MLAGVRSVAMSAPSCLQKRGSPVAEHKRAYAAGFKRQSATYAADRRRRAPTHRGEPQRRSFACGCARESNKLMPLLDSIRSSFNESRRPMPSIPQCSEGSATKTFAASNARPLLACSGTNSFTTSTCGNGWRAIRCSFHFHAGDIISMPDNWEHPWFAAWGFALSLRRRAGKPVAGPCLRAARRCGLI